MKFAIFRVVAALLLATALITLALLPAAAQSSNIPKSLQVKIISIRPHDPQAYTQGLLIHNGFFYESTGLTGESSLRKVDMQTGKILQRLDIPKEFYAEGLALVDDKLIQITYTEQLAFVYDLETFEKLNTFTYIGEGWGLCYDGTSLYMSNGSPFITERDPETFKPIRTFEIKLGGVAVNNLNELECVGDYIYSNIWFTETIIQIDKRDGQIVALIDATNLLTQQERDLAGQWGTFNGIAYDSTTERFFITGKYWPWMFEVEFVEDLPQGYVTPTPIVIATPNE